MKTVLSRDCHCVPAVDRGLLTVDYLRHKIPRQLIAKQHKARAHE